MLIDRETGIALIRVAAAEEAYPVRYATACPARPYLFIDWFNGEKDMAAQVMRCGTAYRAIASAHARGLSGQNWTLYERVD